MKLNQTLKLFALLLTLVMTSCLPVDKETACAENEAYDAQARKCVPTIGTGPNTIFLKNPSPQNSYTTTVGSSSTTHSISVSDVYSYGFTTKWFLTFSTNATTIPATPVASNTSSFIFNPATLHGKGNYVLEAVVYSSDGSILYDSKSWTITVYALAAPQLITPTPATTAFTYASNITSATHSLVLNNPDGVSGSYKVLVDAVQTSTGAFTGAAQTFSETINPSALGIGLHTIEMQLHSATEIYHSYVWTVNVIAPDLPAVNLGSSTPSYYNAVSVISAEPFSATPTSGYRDITNNAINSFCIVVDNADKNSDGTADIDVIFEINGVQQGGVGTFTQGGPITTTNPNDNTYCHATFDTLTLANADISESKSLTVKTVYAGTTNIVELIQWNLNVRPRNVRPLIAISATNTDATLACTASSTVSYTNCSILQSADVDNNGDYVGADDSDNSRNFAIELQAGIDPDIAAETDYEVFFEIRSTSPTFEGVTGASTLTKSDCTYSAVETTGTIGNSKLLCDLKIDAFGAAGNIPPGAYIVQAYIRDIGSTWDANPKESNRVTWTVNVTELQSTNSISVAAQAATHPAPANESWLENNGASCAATGVVVNAATAISENDFLTVHTFVREKERDNFNISISMSNGLVGGAATSSVVPLTVFTKSDNTEYTEVTSCFRVPEWVVSGASDSSATGGSNIEISVSDRPDVQAPQSPASSTTFTALVNNYNPAPVFTDNSNVDLSAKKVFAGMPFSITAPAYTDANTIDGNVVTHKWQVSTDNVAWSDIPNANSTDQTTANLVWTPAPNIQGTSSTVSLRLCLGDDGFGNTADCSVATATKVYQNINVYSSEVETANFPSTNQVGNDVKNISSWYDASTNSLYTAYSLNATIYVNKKITNAAGQLEDFHSISFPTEDPLLTFLGQSSGNPGYLSIDGVDGNTLLVSYNMMNTANSLQQIRIRRLDISDGDLSFYYGGLFNAVANPNDRMTDDVAAGMAFASVGNGDLQITVSTVNDGENFVISTAAGTQTFTVGSNPGELCFPASCAATTAASLAANIASAINNHADPMIAKELTAEHTTGSSVVTIKGPGVRDYYNDNVRVAPIIGNISISPVTPEWAIPFIDINNSFKVSVVHNSNATSSMSLIFPGTTSFIESGTFLKDLKGAFQSDGYYIIGARNDNNNIDLYRLNPLFSYQAPSIQDAYSLGSYDIDSFDLKIGNGDHVYVSSLSTISTTTSDLSAIIAAPDLDNKVANVNFSITSPLVNNIARVGITPSQATAGEATLALITNTTHATPNNLYVGKITHDLATWANPIALSTSAVSGYTPPAINSHPMTALSNISLTKAVSLTRGHLAETSAAEDVAREVFLINSMSVDGVTTRVKHNLINTQGESIMSNTSTGVGASPALIRN